MFSGALVSVNVDYTQIYRFHNLLTVILFPTAWIRQEVNHLEKAHVIDPFGHAGLTPLGKIRLTPLG